MAARKNYFVKHEAHGRIAIDYVIAHTTVYRFPEGCNAVLLPTCSSLEPSVNQKISPNCPTLLHITGMGKSRNSRVAVRTKGAP